MADNFGAKPYDYADYYTPIRGQNEADKLKGNEVAPGQDIVSKLRSLFGMFGADQTPVDLNNPNAGIGEKLRGGLGLAPALQPTATQADVRKSDNAMASPAMPNFGAVLAPAQFTPIASGASQAQVRASDNAIAANTPSQVVDGAWAAPHGASPGIGAQLEAGPATTAVSSSRDANGNLVLTNAPPATPSAGGGGGAAPQQLGAMPIPMPAMPAPVRDTFQNKAASGSLASFFGASMNQKKLSTEEARNTAAAEAEANRMAELQKVGTQTASAEKIAGQKGAANPKDVAEASILSDRLAAARGAKTPEERNALLTGHAPVEATRTVPQGYMGDFQKDVPVFTSKGPGAGQIVLTQPQQQAQVRQGSDGKMYIMGADGKALREATPEELKSVARR